MGIIKTFMISTLHNIGIVRVDHDTNKTIHFFNLFFPIKFFTFYVIIIKINPWRRYCFLFFFQLICSTLSLLCFSFPIPNLSVLFLFGNDPETNFNFVQSNRYLIFGVVSSANCEICILCVCSSIFI